MASVTLAPALVASGLAHQSEGRLSPAEHCYLAALRIDPSNAQATYLMGVLALQSGNAEGAMTYLSRVIAARTDDADALYNMGMAHVLAVDLGEAERWFRQALVVDPDHTAAHFGLGNLERLAHRGAEAVAGPLARNRTPRRPRGGRSHSRGPHRYPDRFERPHAWAPLACLCAAAGARTGVVARLFRYHGTRGNRLPDHR